MHKGNCAVFFFLNRVINRWNALDQSAVDAEPPPPPVAGSANPWAGDRKGPWTRPGSDFICYGRPM